MQPEAPGQQPEPATLWLVRHGQTDWNQEGRYQGQLDLPLNPAGREDARRMAAILAARPLAAIYCSDLLRARQTAEVLARVTGAPLILEPRLREVALGDWEGQLFSDIRARYPEEIRLRLLQPLHSRPPGGETLWEVWLRVKSAVDEIAARHPGQEVAIVAHGLSLAVLIAYKEDHDLSQAFKRIPENGTPIRIEWRVESRES